MVAFTGKRNTAVEMGKTEMLVKSDRMVKCSYRFVKPYES